MVHHRGARHAHLADNLRPSVQRLAGILPIRPIQNWPRAFERLRAHGSGPRRIGASILSNPTAGVNRPLLLPRAQPALGLRGNALPRFALRLLYTLCFGLRRQLQHRRVLPFGQVCQQHDLPIRKFEGVVVRTWIVHVDLPKAGDPVSDGLLPEDQLKSGWNALDLLVERDLGPRQEAHGHLGVADGAESTRGGVPEFCGYQLVFDLRWSRSDTV